MANTPSIDDRFVNKDSSFRAIYDHLLKTLHTISPVEQDPRKTSIHINRKSALVGKVRITALKDNDAKLKTWLNDAYRLAE